MFYASVICGNCECSVAIGKYKSHQLWGNKHKYNLAPAKQYLSRLALMGVWYTALTAHLTHRDADPPPRQPQRGKCPSERASWWSTLLAAPMISGHRLSGFAGSLHTADQTINERCCWHHTLRAAAVAEILVPIMSDSRAWQATLGWVGAWWRGGGWRVK